MCRELLQLFQNLDSTTQKIRSRAVSRGRGSRAFHTASCCRSARFSSANSRCVPTVDRSVRRRIPSHLTMAGQIARSVPQTQENRDGRLFRKDSQGLIETWHDRRIIPGQQIDRAISSELEVADLIL